MRQAHRGVRGVDTLSARTRRAADINADILLVNLHIDLLRFRHHGHRDCRGVDAAAGLRLRHALYPVYARLVFHHGIGPRTV